MQYIEDLTDAQAAQAVRGRIDWKYALSLPLADPGIDSSVLSEFRGRLVKAKAEELLLDRLLERCQERGWLSGGGVQRSDSTHVLAAIRVMHRLEVVGETLRAALNSLALCSTAMASGKSSGRVVFALW
ncbi:MAG: transposase [Moorea sp. SIO3I6]|nr:transposase [Moorena sp. SIO3I6]